MKWKLRRDFATASSKNPNDLQERKEPNAQGFNIKSRSSLIKGLKAEMSTELTMYTGLLDKIKTRIRQTQVKAPLQLGHRSWPNFSRLRTRNLQECHSLWHSCLPIEEIEAELQGGLEDKVDES